MVFSNEAIYEFYSHSDEKMRKQLWQDFISVHVRGKEDEN